MTGHIAKLLLVAAAVAALSGVAQAQDRGPYVFGEVGYSFEGSFDPDDDTLNELEHDDGWLGLVGGGYALANGIRLEGELGYRDNDLSANDFFVFGGHSNAWSLMLNGYYDFNRGGVVQPYLGAGIGAADVSADGAANILSFDDSETVFAYQAMAGLGFSVTPQLTVDLGYRYFIAQGVDFELSDGIEPPTLTGDADYHQQAVTIGLRYSFAPPEPAMAPPPPPPTSQPPSAAACPTSDFVVYFEWDRSDLNTEAQDTIGSALRRARECRISDVRVVGHTDTSGSHEHNQALSERRAQVVSQALIMGGIRQGLIHMEGRGETDLARHTPDGVREPLNRRTAVTITFR